LQDKNWLYVNQQLKNRGQANTDLVGRQPIISRSNIERKSTLHRKDYKKGKGRAFLLSEKGDTFIEF